MTVLTPTKETGATAKSSPVTYGEPERVVSQEQLGRQLMVGPLNAPFIADLLSAVLTHERCGRHLYRSVAARTNNPFLNQRYEHFGEETVHHVELLEALIAGAGANPSYVSPMARAVEAQDIKLVESTFLVDGGLDPLTAEMAMLDAVFVAESVDRANWEGLQRLAGSFPARPFKDSLSRTVVEVLQQEEEHLSWAHQTRATLADLQAQSETLAKAGTRLEELVGVVRNWFS